MFKLKNNSLWPDIQASGPGLEFRLKSKPEERLPPTLSNPTERQHHKNKNPNTNKAQRHPKQDHNHNQHQQQTLAKSRLEARSESEG
jgi:hypothetical protein